MFDVQFKTFAKFCKIMGKIGNFFKFSESFCEVSL